MDLLADVVIEDMKEAFEVVTSLDLVVTVHLTNNDSFTWPAELTRFSGRVDERTGAVGLVVQVEHPVLPDPATRRPPLINGTFVEVRLSAPEPNNAILIERSALRTDPDGSDFVFVVVTKPRVSPAVTWWAVRLSTTGSSCFPASSRATGSCSRIPSLPFTGCCLSRC